MVGSRLVVLWGSLRRVSYSDPRPLAHSLAHSLTHASFNFFTSSLLHSIYSTGESHDGCYQQCINEQRISVSVYQCISVSVCQTPAHLYRPQTDACTDPWHIRLSVQIGGRLKRAAVDAKVEFLGRLRHIIIPSHSQHWQLRRWKRARARAQAALPMHPHL